MDGPGDHLLARARLSKQQHGEVGTGYQVHPVHDSKRFGDFVAVDDVSLSLSEGQLTVLLGPFGSGKTTLLRLIAGLERPDAGHIRVNGQDITKLHVSHRSVGFVFQHYALFQHMNVFDNVAFGLMVKPWRERPNKATIRKRVTELLDLVQLSWPVDRYPSQPYVRPHDIELLPAEDQQGSLHATIELVSVVGTYRARGIEG